MLVMQATGDGVLVQCMMTSDISWMNSIFFLISRLASIKRTLKNGGVQECFSAGGGETFLSTSLGWEMLY